MILPNWQDPANQLVMDMRRQVVYHPEWVDPSHSTSSLVSPLAGLVATRQLGSPQRSQQTLRTFAKVSIGAYFRPA